MVTTQIQRREVDITLPILTESALYNFISLTWGVNIPNTRVCSDHTTPWRALCDAYFARSPVSVWKASRGFAGKSFTLAVLGLTEAATLPADVNILGGSGEQSQNVQRYTNEFWNYPDAPRALLDSDPMKTETRLITGARIKALTASQKSVRGPHPQRLRLDEIDEMDIKILDAALGQPMGKDGIPAQTVMSSTHQYADGTMSEILRRAVDNNWPEYRWCYKECAEPHGWLSLRDIVEKRSTVTSSMWDAEYELQEPEPTTRAIHPDAVRGMFRRDLGTHDDGVGEILEFEEPSSRTQGGTAEYSTGIDWARSQDYTVAVTLRVDCDPVRVVAYQRVRRLAWPTIINRVAGQLNRFPGESYHDATGLGDVIADDLAMQDTVPIIMVGRRRSDILSEYIAGIERGELVSPHLRSMEHEHRLASVEDVYGRGHLPDTIAAGSLAWLAQKYAASVMSVADYLRQARLTRG